MKASITQKITTAAAALAVTFLTFAEVTTVGSLDYAYESQLERVAA